MRMMRLKSNFHHLFVGVYFLSLWSFVNSESPSKNYSSYRRYPWCTPSNYTQYPNSVDDVVGIVKYAINNNVTVKAFGVRHSQTDIICTEGVPIDCRGLRSFRMNPDNITATFGAGVLLREATEFLRYHGRGLRTTPAFGNITIGGAVGTGAHGSTIKYNASISAQVVSMTVVDGTGEVRIISDKEDLKAFRLSLGLLGIIVNVTLYTVPLYKTEAHNYKVSDDILTNGVALDWARNTDQISLYWYPAFKEVVVANWTIVDVNTEGDAYTNDHVPSTYGLFNLIATVAKETAFELTESTFTLANSLGYTLLHVFEFYLELALLITTPAWVPIYTENGITVKNPAVGYYDLMFAPICYDNAPGLLDLACPWAHGDNSIQILDNEFALDVDDLEDFIKAVKDIISKTPTAFPLQGILMRFSDKSDIYLSTAYGRQTVHFEFYLWNRNNPYNNPSGSLAGYQTILQTLTRKFEGRSHWGKSGMVYHSRESLDLKLNEAARQNFIAAMNKFDPNGVFINNFGRRLKRTGTKIDIDPLTTRCALLDNCFCTKNSDCGATQICTTLTGYTYRVCKTKNEIPEYPIDTSKFPSPSGFLGYLLTEVPVLAAAVLANCTVGSLANTTGGIVGGLVGGLLG